MMVTDSSGTFSFFQSCNITVSSNITMQLTFKTSKGTLKSPTPGILNFGKLYGMPEHYGDIQEILG